VSEWTGSWVSRELGVQVRGDGDGVQVDELVGLALRRNPRRAHLLVSRVLGKHVPSDPRLVRAAGLLLGGLVAHELGCAAPPLCSAGLRAALAEEPGAARALRDVALEQAVRVPDACVLGYAETATGLGQVIAEALDAEVYLHSTRRNPAGAGNSGSSPKSTRTPPRTEYCPGTRRCSPATVRSSWLTTSCPPGAPCATPSPWCTGSRRAIAT